MMTTEMDTVGCVPLLIELCPRDNHRDPTVPEPLCLLIPRSSYLMSVAHLVREAFASFVLNIDNTLAVWLCKGSGGVERAVPWHYPVGVLYDLFSPPSMSSGNSGATAAQPLRLTARLTPAIKDAPADVALTVIGSSMALDPNTTDSTTSQANLLSTLKVEEMRRKEVVHAVSVFISQCVKASIISSFGSTRPYMTLDRANSEILPRALTATDEAFFTEGDGLAKFRKAKAALLTIAAVPHPPRYLVAVYDAQLDAVVPKLTTISALQVNSSGPSKDDDDVFTLGHMLALVASNLGGADVFFSIAPATSSASSTVGSAQRHVSPIPPSDGGHSSTPLLSRGELDLMLDEFNDSKARRMERDGGRLLILIDGIEIPLKAPASLIIKHFQGFDFRLHVVLAKVSLE